MRSGTAIAIVFVACQAAPADPLLSVVIPFTVWNENRAYYVDVRPARAGMDAIAYSVCPHCHGPVDSTRAARQGAFDILDAVLLALSDSAIQDPRTALAAVASALRIEEEREIAEHVWPIEELARQVAIASQKSGGP